MGLLSGKKYTICMESLQCKSPLISMEVQVWYNVLIPSIHSHFWIHDMCLVQSSSIHGVTLNNVSKSSKKDNFRQKKKKKKIKRCKISRRNFFVGNFLCPLSDSLLDLSALMHSARVQSASGFFPCKISAPRSYVNRFGSYSRSWKRPMTLISLIS